MFIACSYTSSSSLQGRIRMDCITVLILLHLLSVVGSTFSATVSPPTIRDDDIESETSSWSTTYSHAVQEQNATQRSNDSTQATTQTTTVRKAMHFTSARNASAINFGWPTVPGRSDVNFTDAIEAFLVQSNPEEGDSLTLSCIVYDPRILTVSWYHKVERLTTHNILAPSADVQRMSTSHNIEDDTRRVFNLTIDFLHSDDSGEYTCRGINRPETAVTVGVTVRYVPELHYPECFLNGKRQAIVTEGDELRFECRSQMGIPPWHLIWFRQINKSITVISTPMHELSEMIIIEHSTVASRDINGAMFMCSLVCLSADCVRANDNGPRNCNIGPLIVAPRQATEAPPIINIDPGVQIALEGDDVHFSCSTSLADGNAVWFPVGERPPDDHVLVSNDGSQMAIMNVRDNDTELMACGVFCQDKLITVRQVNMQVLHKQDTTKQTTTTTTTTTSKIISSTTPDSEVTNSDSNDSSDTNSHVLSNKSRNSSVISGIVGGIVVILLILVIIIWVCRKSHLGPWYHRAATSEPQEHPVTV